MKNTNRQTTRATLTDLYRAIDKRQPVTITYVKADGTETVRTIELLDLRVTTAGDIVLRAMDRDSGEARTFRLDRIRSYTRHTRMTHTVPTDTQPGIPAPRTVAALVAYEINRDDITTAHRKHLTLAA